MRSFHVEPEISSLFPTPVGDPTPIFNHRRPSPYTQLDPILCHLVREGQAKADPDVPPPICTVKAILLHQMSNTRPDVRSPGKEPSQRRGGSRIDRHKEYFVSSFPVDEADRSSNVLLGKRQRAKKRLPPRTTPRRLAPRSPEVESDITIGSSETEILDRTHKASSPETLTPNSSSQGSVDEPQEQQKQYSNITKEAPFTFSSPQFLFPAHESLVPKRYTPSSELLKFTRDRPRPALWPHGVTATLAACLFSARALGIDIDRVLDPHYMSPFYRPSFSLTLPPGSEVQPTSPDAASDPELAVLGPLRPCSAQVIFPHHACIDLLPLPRLRETAVMLNVRAQQEERSGMSHGLDGVQELKKDVYVRQGVRFRGTGELRVEEFITYDERGRHCGHPWERGSWAVAPWFARKWKYLVDI